MNIDFLSNDIKKTSEKEKNSLSKKDDISGKYNLPKTVKFCSKCVVSNQRPRITFDEKNVCSACNYWLKKDIQINWDDREKELNDLCNRFRRNDGRFDVIVPSSGGKDSVYVAYELKNKYGMHPLTVTWAPHLYTDIGYRNFQAHIHSGMDNICLTPNGLVHRTMTRISTIEIGDPFQPFIYGQSYMPLRMAVALDIPLIMDGENGEAEYGGDAASEENKGFSFQEAVDYWMSGFPINFWYDYGFTKKDLEIYSPPDIDLIVKKNIERHFFSYYRDWRPHSHYYYCVEKTGFSPNPLGRSEGTYSKYASLDDLLDPLHYYFSLLKFGIARATSDAAHEIREKVITREEGVALVKKFDSEFPSEKSIKVFLDYTNLTEQELNGCFDKWRNQNLWNKVVGKWVLNKQVE